MIHLEYSMTPPAEFLTSAISILIPFGLFLKVGGNNEIMAKCTVTFAAFAPSRVTENLLLVSIAVPLGRRIVWICVHWVWVPLIIIVSFARASPWEFSSARVRGPENDEVVGNL